MLAAPALLFLPWGLVFEESGRLSGEFQVHSSYRVLVQPKKKPTLVFTEQGLLCVDTMLSTVRATEAIKVQSLHGSPVSPSPVHVVGCGT